MTRPMNCPHSEEGWCLSCLKVEWDRWDVITSERFQSEKMVVHDMNSPDHLEPKACAECAKLQRRIEELEAQLPPPKPKPHYPPNAYHNCTE